MIFVSILLQLLFQRRETHGLVPVRVKQISEAHQSGDEKLNFVINGADVANVCMHHFIFIGILLFVSHNNHLKWNKRDFRNVSVNMMFGWLGIGGWDGFR